MSRPKIAASSPDDAPDASAKSSASAREVRSPASMIPEVVNE